MSPPPTSVRSALTVLGLAVCLSYAGGLGGTFVFDDVTPEITLPRFRRV